MSEDEIRRGIGLALGRVPSGLFILTARYEDKSAGMLTSWVQQVSFEPPMVTVAVAKGRSIMPLISESRRFGLCQIAQGEKTLLRRFAGGSDPNEDPFLGLDMVHGAAMSVPILTHCLGYLECEVTCHMDVEGDHDLFVGRVKSGRYNQGEPWIHVRENGLKY